MIKQLLADKSGVPLDVKVGLDGVQCLVVESSRVLSAYWQSADITTATTTTVIKTNPDEAILLTDLIVTLSKKVTSGTIALLFDDGTNTESLFTFDAATSSFQFSHAFQGGLSGWKDASFKVVTNTATTVSVLVGYTHVSVKQAQAYDVWYGNR